jgi:hypothetical protein
MTIKRIFGTCAVGMVAAVSAGGVWLGGAGTALAPEPARLRAPLSETISVSADAYYVNTSTSTTVLRWTGSYRHGTAPAGTPCSTSGMAAGQETRQVIVASGNYRKCV